MSPRMDAPRGAQVGEDARVVVLGRVPVVTHGRVVRADDQQIELELVAPLPGRVRDALILELEGRRVRASVLAIEACRVRLATHEVRAPDRREYPRFHAAVEATWRVAGPEQVAAWMAGRLAGDGAYVAGEPVEVSASGLAFAVDEAVEPGDTLLLTVTLPAGRGAHRCAGRVVRVDAPAPGEPEGAPRVGISLTRATPNLTRALAALTVEAQDAWLFGEG